MSGRPLASLLAHLDAGGRRAAPTPLGGVDPALIEAAAEAARRAGYAEGLAEGERRLAGERLRAAETLTTRLQDERADWTRDQAELLAARLTDAFAGIETRLVEAVAATLRPLVAARVAEAALDRMADEIRRLLGASDEGAAITLSAPADLIAGLRARLGAAAGVDFVERDTVDAEATLGRTRVETRLAAWAERLERDA